MLEIYLYSIKMHLHICNWIKLCKHLCIHLSDCISVCLLCTLKLLNQSVYLLWKVLVESKFSWVHVSRVCGPKLINFLYMGLNWSSSPWNLMSSRQPALLVIIKMILSPKDFNHPFRLVLELKYLLFLLWLSIQCIRTVPESC